MKGTWGRGGSIRHEPEHVMDSCMSERHDTEQNADYMKHRRKATREPFFSTCISFVFTKVKSATLWCTVESRVVGFHLGISCAKHSKYFQG